MQWISGQQITIEHESAPESDQGPSLAFDPFASVLNLAYVGKGGHNMYLSSAVIDRGNPVTWQNPVWQGNKQVKLPNGSEPTANSAPAIAFFPFTDFDQGVSQGSVYVYTEKKSGEVHLLGYTGNWIDLGRIPSFPNIPFSRPIVTSCRLTNQEGRSAGYLLHLAVHDIDEGILWYTTTTDGTNWALPQAFTSVEARAVQQFCLCSTGDTAFLCGFTKDSVRVFKRVPNDYQWNYVATQGTPKGGINPDTSAVAGYIMDLIYTPWNKSEMYTADGISAINVQTLDSVSQVLPNNAPAKTDKAPGALPLTSDAGDFLTLFVAYKGHSSDKLYLASAVL